MGLFLMLDAVTFSPDRKEALLLFCSIKHGRGGAVAVVHGRSVFIIPLLLLLSSISELS